MTEPAGQPVFGMGSPKVPSGQHDTAEQQSKLN